MPESIIAKFGAYIVDGLLWIIGVLFALLGGFLWYKWKRHEGRVDTIAEKVSKLENTVVYRSDLDAKSEEIQAKVKEEHERIIKTLETSIETMREELVTCNQSVMSHVSSLSTDIREIRDFMFQHLERRQQKRD